MTAETSRPKRSLFQTWIRATTVGWLIGFVLVIVLAMFWDMFGGGAQFMVGIGMGAGVGYMQARVVKIWTGGIQPWLWTSVIGMGVPFAFWDIATVTGMEVHLSLPAYVLLGGLLAGILQQRLLRPKFQRTFWWIPACVLGWGLPAGIIALANSGLSPVFKISSTIVMFFGGLLLGAVTGKTLQWMSPGEPSDQGTRTNGIAAG